MNPRRANRNEAQGDLFADPRELYPVLAPTGVVTASESKLRLAQAISEALHSSPKSREQIADEMRRDLGDDSFSVHMLNAYASPARESHDITVTRLRALVKVTDAMWLWQIATEGQGVTIMAGADAIYAQRGRIQQQIEHLKAMDRQLTQLAPLTPMTTPRPKGRGR